MNTQEEWKVEFAKRYVLDLAARVSILIKRVAWHYAEMGKADNSAERASHEELIRQDEDTLDEFKEANERWTEKTKHPIQVAVESVFR